MCCANTQVKHVVVARMGDLLGGVKGTMVNFVVRKVKKMVPAFSLPAAVHIQAGAVGGQQVELEAGRSWTRRRCIS